MNNNASMADVDEYLYLLGRPPLRDFIRFVKELGLDGADATEEPLAGAWRRAEARIRDLIVSESVLADDPPMAPIPADMVPSASAALEPQAVQRALRFVRHQWWMVEIDRLVVYQHAINRRFVQESQRVLPAKLSNEDLLQLAIGRLLPPPKIQVAESSGHYWVASKSSDLRFLDTLLLDPSSVASKNISGEVSHVIGVCVGFGFNYFNAIHTHNRLILTNGTHRLCLLRESGITHAPCLVSHVRSEEELGILLPPEVKERREYFLKGPRPPLFKDYLDPQLRAIVPTRSFARLLRLELKTQRELVPSV